jgi:hypothetical protein
MLDARTVDPSRHGREPLSALARPVKRGPWLATVTALGENIGSVVTTIERVIN